MSRTEAFARPDAFAIAVDGREMAAHPGETLAAALLSAETLRFRDDRAGAARGPFCNMGTCSECMVWIEAEPGAGFVRRRACLAPVVPGMRVLTREPDAADD